MTFKKSPKHLSHSSRESLERCAKAYYLRYFTDAPRRPALWSIGGSAVHQVTEIYDKEQFELGGEPREWTERAIKGAWDYSFGEFLGKAKETEPNEWNWGRSKTEPIEVWNTNGPAFIQSYIDWRKRSPYEIWTTPDGQPAIELDVSGMLPGCPVEIKAYLDRVFRDPVLDRLIVLDLKSGKKPPKDGQQFGTYGALLKAKYGVQADLGVPFLNRQGTLGKPYELAEYTPEAVGAVFGEAWDKVQAGQFPANGFPGNCFVCDLQWSCHAIGGPLAAQFDPSHPANEVIPF